MNEQNPTRLLRNPDQQPDDDSLKRIVHKDIFDILEKINHTFQAAGIALEWRYYNDGKAWLGKAVCRKKTIVWISVWEPFVRACFYFTEKTRQEVMELDIDEEIISSFAAVKPVGKLLPLIVDVMAERSLHDFTVVLNFKKRLVGMK